MRKRTRNGLIGIITSAVLTLGGCEGTTDEKAVIDNQKNVYDVYSEIQPTINGKAIAIVVDTSGSMEDSINKEVKIESAKKSLQSILEDYREYAKENKEVKVGLFYFLNDKVRCAVPVNTFDYDLLNLNVNGLVPSARTPLGISLAYAERELDKTGYLNKNIVLLTDGMSNIGMTPESVFESINKTNAAFGDSKTNLYIIAFNTDPTYFDDLKKQGATVYEAKDSAELSRVLKENTELILEKVE